MKRMMILVVIGFCFGLFGQPKPFDPDYYRDTLKLKKSDEFKKLESYREKYKTLGLPSALSDWHEKQYPTYFADWFYHRGINVDKIEEYKKIGIFKLYGVPGDIGNKILRPIIVIAKLTSFERGFYDDMATFEIVEIIKGREYYEKFPKSIKCYSISQGETDDVIGDVTDDGRDRKFVTKKFYFSKRGPVNGDEFILYLDIFKKENVDFYRKNEDEFGKTDIFFSIEGEYLNYTKADYYEKNKSRGQAALDKLLEKLKKLDELNIKK